MPHCVYSYLSDDMLFVMCLLRTKLHWFETINLSMYILNCDAMIFVTILYMTLPRLIEQNCLMVFGLFTLGIRTTNVLLTFTIFLG